MVGRVHQLLVLIPALVYIHGLDRIATLTRHVTTVRVTMAEPAPQRHKAHFYARAEILGVDRHAMII